MADKKYRIVYCWNGSMREVAFTDEYDSKEEWESVIDELPYDCFYANDTTLWIDYGDNDD